MLIRNGMEMPVCKKHFGKETGHAGIMIGRHKGGLTARQAEKQKELQSGESTE